MLLHFLTFARVRIDHGNPAGLGETLAAAAHQGFVQTGFDNFMPHVIGAIHVKPFLIVPEPDGEGCVVYQNQMTGIERNFKFRLRLPGVPGQSAGDHELPQGQVLLEEGIELALRMHGGPR